MAAPTSWTWVMLQLDLDVYDRSSFASSVDRCRDAGYRFTTMSDVGSGPAALRALYELNKECAADIPDRGPFFTFEEYLAERIHSAGYRPDGVVIGLAADLPVGLAMSSDWRDQGYVFNEMTGVVVRHRRHGLARAMKVLGLDFARSCGVRYVRTMHHPSNEAAITMNRGLGFIDAEFPAPGPA